jgi:hypothetical protein
VSANDSIEVMLAHLDGGGELAPEHIKQWKSALTALQARGPMRDRLDAFSKLLGIEQGKAGRRRKIVPLSVLARRADAVAAFRLREKKTGNTYASLKEVARIFGCTEADLDEWSGNRLLVHLSRLAQNDGATVVSLLDAEADAYLAAQKSR